MKKNKGWIKSNVIWKQNWFILKPQHEQEVSIGMDFKYFEAFVHCEALLVPWWLFLQAWPLEELSFYTDYKQISLL